jgi:hypothetical protein
VESGGGTWYLNRTSGDGGTASYPRCATTMLLIEIEA